MQLFTVKKSQYIIEVFYSQADWKKYNKNTEFSGILKKGEVHNNWQNQTLSTNWKREEQQSYISDLVQPF